MGRHHEFGRLPGGSAVSLIWRGTSKLAAARAAVHVQTVSRRDYDLLAD